MVNIVLDNNDEIIISGDMVAVDAYCSELIQRYDPTFNPENRVKPQLKYAETLGLGTADLSQVELVEINLRSLH
jgi:uncharacterized Fe-S center protein